MVFSMRKTATTIILVLIFISSTTIYAHKASDGFLTIDIEGTTVSGQHDLALKDLEPLFGLDQNDDGKITWGELQSQQSSIQNYTFRHLSIRSNDKPCHIDFIDMQVSNYSDGAFASLIFNTSCQSEPVTNLQIQYNLLFDFDAQHRGLVNISYRDQTFTHVFSNSNRDFTFDPLSGGQLIRLKMFCVEGLKHIFNGYDHMLFLIALILPAVYRSEKRKLIPRDNFKNVLIDAVKVISAFTLAHTVSLCLTSFDLISVPPTRWVESLVAFTIILTSVNNLAQIIGEKRWVAGFIFGLIHGIGYASVLTDLGLQGWNLAAPLIGFNLGVELAQIAIIASVLPFAFLLRHHNFYRLVFLWGGSLATAILGTIWMIEQISNTRILNF